MIKKDLYTEYFGGYYSKQFKIRNKMNIQQVLHNMMECCVAIQNPAME